MNIHRPAGQTTRQWPAEGVRRVPYWVYSDRDLYEQEQERVFRGPIWSFLCLEADVAEPETYRVSNLGDMSVVVTRDKDGRLHAFENRCAHRGSLLCLKERGTAKDIVCVYHNWSYDLAGNLTGVAFRRGTAGKGGMAPECRPEVHGPRKLRIATVAGLVFGTMSPDTPPIEDYLGEEIVAHMHRVMRRPVKLLGEYSQALPNNWKLYIENVKDSYHASLLHTFYTTFRLNRFTQKGGLIVNKSGGAHISFSMSADVAGTEYEESGMRSAQQGFKLEAGDMLLKSVDEFGDGIGVQILGVFPNFVLQQIRNSLAVRRLIPRGVDRSELVWTVFGFVDDDAEMTELRLRQGNLIGPAGFISMEDGAAGGWVQRAANTAPGVLSVVEMGGSSIESSESRVNEAAVRGVWTEYRRCMGL